MQHRIEGLDIVRTLAISSVILFHCDFGFVNGYLGVDLFFLLSGFLMTGYVNKLIVKNNIKSSLNFLLRRGLRIWPLYFSFLGLIAVLSASTSTEISFLNWISFIFYWQNYSPDFIHIVSHIWSLCIEEHFYLLLPLVIFFYNKQGIVKNKKVYFSFVLLAFFIIHLLFGKESAPFTTHNRIFELFLGLMLYQFSSEVSTFFNKFKLLFLFTLISSIIIMMIDVLPINDQWYLYLCLLLFSILIISSLSIKTIFNKTFKNISDLSYALYLFHVPILYLIPNKAISLIVIFAAALAARKLIEEPFLKLRDKYLKHE